MREYISVDIGGTFIKHGVIRDDGIIISKGQSKTHAEQGGKALLENVKTIIEHYLTDNKPEGICISTAGIIDPIRGEVLHANPNIPNYKGTKIKEEIESAFKIPCEVENDVNCAGLAEYISGAAKGASVALCLTIGTGIGGCVLIDGKVFHGFSNSACEIGYMHMGDSNFENLGASSRLVSKVATRKGDKEEEWNGYRVFEAAKNQDKIAIQAIDEMVDTLGLGIANICYVINPEVVVLGGGIMAQEDFLRDKLEKSLSKYLIPYVRGATRLEFAKHQNDAGLLGAYYNFKQRHSSN